MAWKSTVPALSTCSQTSSVLLGIELGEASSTGCNSTKPGLIRETEASKLDSAGKRRRVGATKFGRQSSFQPKTSRRRSALSTRKRPVRSTIVHSPIRRGRSRSVGPINRGKAQRWRTQKRSPESQKGEGTPGGEGQRNAHTHSKDPGHTNTARAQTLWWWWCRCCCCRCGCCCCCCCCCW